jgi:hypothetical protein
VALKEHERALQAHAAVDARCREIGSGTVGSLVVLHEDRVPELEEPVFAAVRRSPTGTELGPEVVEDLAGWTTRSRVGHAPEVGVAHALHPLRRQADEVAPDRLGFVVCLVHRDPQPVGVEVEHLRHELPRPRDGFLLEVVAEAEVPEHLEEAEVAVRATDVIEVVVLASDAHALLHRGGSRVRRPLLPDEIGDEWDHPRVREHRGRRVRRDEAGRFDRGVAALDEEVEEGAA